MKPVTLEPASWLRTPAGYIHRPAIDAARAAAWPGILARLVRVIAGH